MAIEASDQQFLLSLARLTVANVAAGLLPPEIPPGTLAPALLEKRACFVTLTHAGNLRGCVGQLLPEHPLFESVIRAAANAATHDTRFETLRPDEVEEVTIEITLLGESRPLSFDSPEALLAQLDPPRHGVILTLGLQVATFLPRVWSRMRGKVEFMDRLAEKAGCGAGAWRSQDAKVSVYEAEAFAESRRPDRYRD